MVTLIPQLGSKQTKTIGSSANPIAFGGGFYWVSGTNNGDGTYEITSNARYGDYELHIDTTWKKSASLANFVIFAGNDSEDPTYQFDLGGYSTVADAVSGRVYVHGDLDVTQDSLIIGDVYSTGTIGGSAIKGVANDGWDPIPVPDLHAMDYENTADFTIDSSTPFDGDGELPESDPRHIIVEEFRDDLSDTTGFKFDNTNYFFGDPHERSNISEVSVSEDGNNKVYFVDGNVWIEPMGKTSQIVNSPPDGTKITIVAKGNIYFADNLLYDDYANDGVLFVAMSDGESYTDLDGDNQYDPGEPILHDDGDGIYEGAAEGSGNVFFGDPNGGPLGHVHGFIYAENNFEDHVLDPNGKPLPFEVTGFHVGGRAGQHQPRLRLLAREDDRELRPPPRGTRTSTSPACRAPG